jgi:hypothetical protein
MLFVCADAIAPTEKATKRPQRESAVEARRIGVQLTSISTFRTHTTGSPGAVRCESSTPGAGESVKRSRSIPTLAGLVTPMWPAQCAPSFYHSPALRPRHVPVSRGAPAPAPACTAHMHGVAAEDYTFGAPLFLPHPFQNLERFP